MDEQVRTLVLAYVKDIPIGEETGGYVFTESKAQFRGSIVFLKKIQKKNNIYQLLDSRNMFHADWLKCITETNMDANDLGIAQLRQPGVGTIHRIVSFKMTGFQHTTIDLETKERLNNLNGFYYGDQLTSRYGNHAQSIGRIEECSYCHEPYLPMSTRNDGMCTKCFDSIAISCEHCGDKFIKDEHHVITFEGKTYVLCDNCKSRIDVCDKCGKPCFSEEEYHTHDEQCICNRCWDKMKIVTCERCGISYEPDETIISKKKNGSYLCKLCHQAIIIGSRVREYSYKPDPTFFNEPGINTRLYYGVELEINTPANGSNRDYVLRYLEDNVNFPDEFLYCKHDSSIGMGANGREGHAGFEIVTHPMAYEYMIGSGREKIQKIMSLSKLGCKSYKTDTCGMHVHMSKRAFTSSSLGRYLHFIFDNRDFNLMISERKNIAKVDEYCSFTPDYSIETLADRMTNGGSRSERHKAVNLNCPNTVELRIFRGTLNYGRFMKNIEYCKAVFDFSCTTTANTVDNFKQYVKDNSNRYPNLFMFLDKKKELK